MVITLQIDKVDPGLYRAVVLSSGVEVTAPTMHASIEEAISTVTSDVPEGFAHFAVVTYGSVCSGTMSLKVLPERAAQIADQLIAIVSEMHQVGQLILPLFSGLLKPPFVRTSCLAAGPLSSVAQTSSG